MAVAELAPGDRIAGCVVESELGRGGMGVVYRARQESLERTVAVKVISPGLAGDAEFARRFEREARLAASIEHPSVVPIHAAGEEDGRLYLVMRFVDGTDLFNEVATHGPLEAERVARLATQLAGALDAAHARGLVHRDVKPANVLLSGAGEAGHALLTDFGLTKEAAGQTGLTATGQFLGTLDYMAPEQLDGRDVDARTDVYALGCLLFECLSGRPPFPGSPAAKMYAHINTPPPALEGLPAGLGPGVDEALARAMAKDPAQRFPSAGDLARALTAAVQGRANAAPERSVAVGAAATQVGALGATVIDAPPSPRPRREPRPPAAPVAAVAAPPEPPAQRRRAGLLAGAAAALLLVGGGAGAAVALLGGDKTAPPPPPTPLAGTPAGEEPSDEEEPPPEPDPEPDAEPVGPDFAAFTPPSGAYTIDEPLSGGWSRGAEEAVNSRLDRVTWNGPGGETVWVDSTPADRPAFRREDKDVLEERTVPHDAFGSMQEFVFTGEPDFCTDQRCVVLLIDPGDGSGYGIIGGGGDAEEAIRVARRMGASLRP